MLPAYILAGITLTAGCCDASIVCRLQCNSVLNYIILYCASLQEVLIALNDKHRSLTKRPSLSSDDIKDVPHASVKLMQQCWHKVSPCDLKATAHLDCASPCDCV